MQHVGIIDHGFSNLKAWEYLLTSLKYKVSIIHEFNDEQYDGIILPGVGNFQSVIENMRAKSLDKKIVHENHRNTKILAVCVGMQVLFSHSEESPGVAGLSLIDGNVIKNSAGRNSLNIGWNRVGPDPFYFIHNYGVQEKIECSAKYINFRNNVILAYGQIENLHFCQFHPEKSGKHGKEFIQKILDL